MARRFRMKPSKNEVFAKNSSLALQIHEDTDYEFSFYVYNRRTNSIIGWYKISLLEHCRRTMLDVTPIPKVKKK